LLLVCVIPKNIISGKNTHDVKERATNIGNFKIQKPAQMEKTTFIFHLLCKSIVL